MTAPTSQEPVPELAGSRFELPGTLRRIRRTARLSQRQLAAATGLSASVIAEVETGRRSLSAVDLARLAAVADLQLVLVDASGKVVPPMRRDAVRDEGGRRYPAHCDVRHGDEGWWYLPHRAERPLPWFTFDLTPYRDLQDDDHPAPSPEDDPRRRADKREHVDRIARAARHRALRDEHLRRLAAGEIDPEPEALALCTCPPGCLELLEGDDEDGQLDPHVGDCTCRCDVC